MLLPLLEPEQEQRNDIWAYISPSRLNCWLSCPLKFKLRYVDGIKTPSTPALFLGKQVHSGLEIFYRYKMLGITLEQEAVAGRMVDGWDQAVSIEHICFETMNEELSLKKQSVDLVAAYLAQIPADESPPSAVEVKMEAPLIDPSTGEDLGIPLLGIVDLILAAEEGPVIVDFKSSSRSAPPFEVTHEVQLSSYAYLYRQLTGQRESGLEIRSLVKTKTPKIETHAYAARSERHLARLFAVIREYLDCLDSGRFNFRPGWGCSMCDFRSTHCSTWAGAETS